MKEVAESFSNSTLVSIASAGHETIFWSGCAWSLASQFVETLGVTDTQCTNNPGVPWPAVGRFPLHARDARPAESDTSGQNQIGLAEQKVVTAAVAAATDAEQRSLVGAGDGPGLRAGTFHTDYGTTALSTTLTNCAFATDVIVNGTVTWGYDNSFVADLVVTGAGTAGGSLHVNGAFQVPGPVGNFEVTGTLGGKRVAVLVPEG